MFTVHADILFFELRVQFMICWLVTFWVNPSAVISIFGLNCLIQTPIGKGKEKQEQPRWSSSSSLPLARVTMEHVFLHFWMAALSTERAWIILLLVTSVTYQAIVMPLRTRSCATLYTYSAILNTRKNKNKKSLLYICNSSSNVNLWKRGLDLKL